MRTFRQCLESARHQTSPCREIIVVDRFSQDGLLRFASSNGATVLQSNTNRSEARNIGLQNVSSEGVLFVDADMILPPMLIQECEQGLEKHDAIVIPEESVGIGFWAECKAAERRLHIGDNNIEAPRCFRRSALLRLGGYNPQLEAGEDWDLRNRAKSRGQSIGRVRATIIHDEGQLTIPRILLKEFHYGQTFGKYVATNPHIAFKQVNPVERIIVPSFKVASKDGLHGMGILILRTLEFAAASMGHVVGRREP